MDLDLYSHAPPGLACLCHYGVVEHFEEDQLPLENEPKTGGRPVDSSGRHYDGALAKDVHHGIYTGVLVKRRTRQLDY